MTTDLRTVNQRRMPLSSMSTPRPTRVDAGLALLRLIAGATFAAHGGQKLFVFGFAGVGGAFAGMGVPLPGIVGPAIGVLEFFGGLALVFGLMTRLVGFGLACDMLGAIAFVHFKNGFFLPTGVEFVLSLCGAAATLALTGAGAFSFDAIIARRRGSR